MAKRRNSFDPDALAKAGQEIAKKHQIRENVSVQPPKVVEEKPVEKVVEKVIETPIKEVEKKKAAPKKTAKSKATKAVGNEKTQLCRIGLSFHRRVKLEAVKNDMTIRQFLEELIEKHIP